MVKTLQKLLHKVFLYSACSAVVREGKTREIYTRNEQVDKLSTDCAMRKIHPDDASWSFLSLHSLCTEPTKVPTSKHVQLLATFIAVELELR